MWHDECTNAIYVQIDDIDKVVLGNDPVFDTWHWCRGFEIDLKCGFHTLHLSNHSDNVAVQKVLLTDSAERSPSGKDLATIELFYDDFNGCDHGNFPLWKAYGGEWSVKRRENHDRSNNLLIGKSSDHALLALSDRQWNEYSLTVSVFSPDGGEEGAWTGICFGLESESEYCQVRWSEEPSGGLAQMEVVRVTTEGTRLLAAFQTPWDSGQWHVVELDVQAKQLLITIDGGIKHAARLEGKFQGGIGLSLAGDIETRFDNVRVWKPGAVGGLLPGAGCPVGILLPNSQAFVRAVLATWYSGNVVVPISPTYSDEAVKHVADTLGVVLFITDQAGRRRLRDFRGACLTAEAELIRERPGCRDESMANPLGFSGAHAVVFLTSGTTGTPKIVGLTHDNIRCNLDAVHKCLPRCAYEKTYVGIPMCHSYGFTLGMLASLTCGGSLYIGRPHTLGTDLAKELAASGCTSVFGVVPLFRMLADGVARAGLEEAAGEIKCLVNGAASMTQELLAALHLTFPRADISLTYGLSEASPLVTALPPSLVEKKGCSIGMPVEGVDLRLLTAQGQLTSATGIEGEILIRGGSVIGRYMGSARAADERFYQGFLKTGDLGCLDDDGCVYFRGRLKDLINRGGVKVYPCDVEEVLLRHHAIAQAAVVACGHPVLGEVPFAFVRPADGSTIDCAEIRQWSAEKTILRLF